MKEIQNILAKEMVKRFKANKLIEGIGNQIEKYTEKSIFQKYKDVPHFADGMKFQLIGVNAFCSNYYIESITPAYVSLYLRYCCVSKLPKDKRERTEKIKREFKETKQFPHDCPYKYPTWITLQYSVEIERIYNGKVDLIINEILT